MRKRILPMILILGLCVLSQFSTASADDGVWSDTSGLTEFTFKVTYHCDDDKCDPSDGHVLPKMDVGYRILPMDTDIESTATTPAVFAGERDAFGFEDSEGEITDLYYTDTWYTSFQDCQQEENVTLKIDPSKFMHSGIYRYTIKEELPRDATNLGIHNTSNAEHFGPRIIDLYVIENASNPGTFMVSDAVMACMDPSTVPSLDPSDPSNAQYRLKKDSFDYEVPLGTVRLVKQVTGNAGDKTEKFPFTIELQPPKSGSIKLNSIEPNLKARESNWAVDGYPVVVTGSADAVYSATGNTVGSSFQVQMPHDGYIEFKAPIGAIVWVGETVNAGEGYLLSSEVTGCPSWVSSQISEDDELHTESEPHTKGQVIPDSDLVITYTNKRDQISPTGVITRYLPFVILLGAAVVLTVTAKSHKEHA